MNPVYQELTQLRQRWDMLANPNEAFLSTFVERAPTSKVSKEYLYDRFKRFCESNLLPIPTVQMFTQYLFKNYDVITVEENGARFYEGIQFIVRR